MIWNCLSGWQKNVLKLIIVMAEQLYTGNHLIACLKQVKCTSMKLLQKKSGIHGTAATLVQTLLTQIAGLGGNLGIDVE